jgi:hypothetical protein
MRIKKIYGIELWQVPFLGIYHAREPILLISKSARYATSLKFQNVTTFHHPKQPKLQAMDALPCTIECKAI